MKKFIRALCLLAILCVAYFALTQPQSSEKPAIEDIESEADDLVDQVKDMYEEYGSAAVAQADEKLGDVVEQADEAIGEAVESAVEGAKEVFLESIKESISSFFQDLSS